MKTLYPLILTIAAYVVGQTAMAQPPFRPNDARFPGASAPRGPSILTHIPSAAGGERGIAVGVLPPLKPRYAHGAPVVIQVPSGVTTGGTEGRPEYAGLGFVEIRFAFPGGGLGEGASGGTYDYRGPHCIRALADVIRFATGRLADQQGRTIRELVPTTTVLTPNVGVVGSSHGGNACGLVMATHGEEFPDLAFYASMESPYGEGNVNIELGGRDQGVNPAYVKRILASGGPRLPDLQRTFPDNEAGAAWDRRNIRTGLEPEDLPMQPYMQAAVCELADRVQSQNWAKNLDAVLFPDSPWTAFGGRQIGRPAGVRPPLGKRPLGGMKRAPSEAAGPQALQQRIPEDAGSTDAPLLFCIGAHVEPLGATVSTLVRTAPGGKPPLGPRPTSATSGFGSRPDLGYEVEALFRRHIADLQALAAVVERHGGKLTMQAQTPFTRRLAHTEHPLLRDFERRGHEVALHFHENAHLGPDCDALPVQTWTDVMREEIDWLRKAGATRVRYWSGGNLYAHVLEAASLAGLEVMSDYKNPRTQRDDERLLAVNPWRPAQGPSQADLAGFAEHSSKGQIVYLPNGVFERVDHSAMRRSADLGGDYPYFDALTRGLELSLRAARPDRVNVFHITVHAGEFRGGAGAPRPFAVIDDWLAEVVVPLVKAGKVRWASFSQMAEAFHAWEKANPDAPPRAPAGRPDKPAPASAVAKTTQGYITFVINTHDWGRVDKSAETLLRLIELFTKHKVRGDFYLTAPVVEAYARSRPEVIERLRDSRMTISYHFRPPHPAYAGFDAPLGGLDDDALRATLKDYETFRQDLVTGAVQRDQPGGYTHVKQMLGTAPVAVSAMGNPRAKAALLDIYRGITVLIHENDFYVRGGPSWNAFYLGRDGRTPLKPPYDLGARDPAEPRTAENQAAIWRAYEELVIYAARSLQVVTSAEIVRMAKGLASK